LAIKEGTSYRVVVIICTVKQYVVTSEPSCRDHAERKCVACVSSGCVCRWVFS